MNSTKIISSILFFLPTLLVFGQDTITPALAPKQIKPYNRAFEILHEQYRGNPIIRIKGKPDAGIAWIKGLTFENGIIEFDVKGKDIVQQSFVGVAFHGLDDNTYQAIYFRPFNFRSKDPIRKMHAVQYIALPDNDWPYLRETYPQKYEASVPSTVDPNEWFHVKLIIGQQTIAVFINSYPQPILSVKSLMSNGKGKVGFWTGNGSDGDFSGLVVIKH
ncbi:hypothetical protein ACR78Z_10285 [Sphingobacterium thalpophilum]|uniref:3-keto-disaccharide hydrolase domain-containing protein n=1 Tax=Sphingobacterium thalpophilum TaxID=259 RepID=A0A4U9V7L7_9SPHI|nr:hypothetical protein [Sphingobacterium thalpophilum]VTR41707.1 Uncharacterised protein [Sphingobacterium thalpophilum]